MRAWVKCSQHQLVEGRREGCPDNSGRGKKWRIWNFSIGLLPVIPKIQIQRRNGGWNGLGRWGGGPGPSCLPDEVPTIIQGPIRVGGRRLKGECCDRAWLVCDFDDRGKKGICFFVWSKGSHPTISRLAPGFLTVLYGLLLVLRPSRKAEISIHRPSPIWTIFAERKKKKKKEIYIYDLLIFESSKGIFIGYFFFTPNWRFTVGNTRKLFPTPPSRVVFLNIQFFT